MLDKETIKMALEVWPYQNLYDIANAVSEKVSEPAVRPKRVDIDSPVKDVLPKDLLSEDERILGYHIVTSLFIPYKQRGIQLKFSMRRLEKTWNSLVAKEMAKEIEIGRNLFMVPTEKLYEYLVIGSPYKRGASIEHAFCVLFVQHCIEADPAVQKTAIEVPTDNRGSAIDCVSYLKNGDRIAWEVTVNCTDNIASHATKLRGKGFSSIIFACRDHHIRKSVNTIIDDAGFDPDFRSTIDTALFGDLFKKRKKL
jgi:hypothetical protein